MTIRPTPKSFILEHPIAAILLDMGLGKNGNHADRSLRPLLFDSFEAHRILVIAPLRVASQTWPDELRKWEHLSDLRFSVAVGTEAERKAALKVKADIYIINRENVQWLIEDSGIPFNYDTVVIDDCPASKTTRQSASGH